MTERFDDELNRQLSSLESELGTARLPGAAAARRRAAQRTRHQVTGGVLGGVAVIAMGVVGITQPTFTTAPAPAGTPSDGATPTVVPTDSAPSPNPTGDSADDEPDGTGTVPPEAFLTVGDIQVEGTDWAEVPAQDSWLPCVPQMPESAEARSFESPAESSGTAVRLDQFIERTADGQAESRLDAVRRAVTDCADGGADTSLIQVWSVDGVGDEAYLIALSGPPTTSETITYVTVGLVRSGDYVMSVFDGGAGMDYNGPAPETNTVAAVQRLCEPLGVECPGELEREQLYPEPVGELEGWLTATDVAEATGLAQITQGGNVTDPTEGGPGGWPYIGLPRDPMADGAESMQHRAYNDPLELGGVTVDETIARFGDEASAREHYDQLIAAANDFQQDGDVITATGTVEGDGYAGASWRSESSEFGTVFVYGVVVRGPHVASVSSAVEEITGEQLNELLDRAAQRLGEGPASGLPAR